MADIKKQIINWFYGPQDFDAGLRLLEQVSKKNKVLGKLIHRGRTRSTVEKLVWELNKVAGLKKIPAPTTVKLQVVKEKPQKPQKVKAPKTKKDDGDGKLKFNLIGKDDIDSYPPAARRLVKEYSSLYMQRGKKLGAIQRLPEDNSEVTIGKRVKLIDEIKKISTHLELLFKSFTEFKETGSFDAKVLWPEVDTNVTDVQKPAANIEDLKTQKKNIQSSITKDRNLLLFGTKAKPKDGKENPMPAGPKRTKLENRVAKKEKDIVALDESIVKLG